MAKKAAVKTKAKAKAKKVKEKALKAKIKNKEVAKEPRIKKAFIPPVKLSKTFLKLMAKYHVASADAYRAIRRANKKARKMFGKNSIKPGFN